MGQIVHYLGIGRFAAVLLSEELGRELAGFCLRRRAGELGDGLGQRSGVVFDRRNGRGGLGRGGCVVHLVPEHELAASVDLGIVVADVLHRALHALADRLRPSEPVPLLRGDDPVVAGTRVLAGVLKDEKHRAHPVGDLRSASAREWLGGLSPPT